MLLSTTLLRHRLSGRALVIICISACVVTAAIIVSARTWLASTTPAIKTGQQAQAKARPNPPAGGGGVERIRVTSNGFEPAEVRRPKGPFYLLFNHSNHLPEIKLLLKRADGGKLREVGLKRNGRKGRHAEFLNLPPGRYVLTEASHPEWICRITITP
jgi:hypothetical protein